MRADLARFTLALVVAFVLLAAGHFLVLQRNPSAASGALLVRGDAVAYLSMTEQGLESAPPPYRHRVLVPLVARLLPLPPLDALRAVSYASLFLVYVFGLLLCWRAGVSSAGAVAGLVVVWSSPPHLYNYLNPFLTDSFGLLALTLMTLSLLAGWAALFATSACLGVLGREATLLFVPAWLFGPGRRRGLTTAAIIVLAVLVMAVPRVALGGAVQGVTEALARYGTPIIDQPLTYVRDVVAVWGLVWFMSIAGLLHLERNTFPRLAGAYLALALAAAATSFIAADRSRMFSILTPVLIVCCGRFVEVAWRNSPALAAAVLAVIALRSLAWTQTVVLPLDMAIALRTPAWYAQLAVAVVATFVLRTSLAAAARSNLVEGGWWRGPKGPKQPGEAEVGAGGSDGTGGTPVATDEDGRDARRY